MTPTSWPLKYLSDNTIERYTVHIKTSSSVNSVEKSKIFALLTNTDEDTH